jgi:hypothetical protein
VFLSGLIGLCGAWHDSEIAADWRADFFGASSDCNFSDKEIAVFLDVPQSKVCAMRSGEIGGPAMARIAFMPSQWQVAFIMRRAQRFAVKVIQDAQIENLIAEVNKYMTVQMNRDLDTRILKATMAKAGKERIA